MKTDILSESVIRDNLCNELKDLPIFIHSEIDSTNNEAKRMITDGKISHALILSDSQTSGRGRSGHTFFSPGSTGIYMSYVFTPESLTDAHRMTTKASVCVLEAIKNLYGIDVSVKWVNDIYLSERKICGILTEAVTFGINTGSLVVGIGINFRASDLPSEISDIAGFLPEKENVTRNLLVADIVSRLHFEASELSSTEYIKKYRQASMLTGKDITYFENDIKKSAHVIGIDDDAGLVVGLPDGTETTLRNGEVFTIRPVAHTDVRKEY